MNRSCVIEAILEIELDMFVSVNGDARVGCQLEPEAFLSNRRAQFAPWSPETLASYLDDLRQAKNREANLMRLKYARMEGLIGRQNQNSLVDEMARISLEWQREMFRKYPCFMSGARPLTDETSLASLVTSFETYLRSEYETYSDRTLTFLHADMMARVERGTNMAEEVYAHLAAEAGFASLDEAESLLEERRMKDSQTNRN